MRHPGVAIIFISALLFGLAIVCPAHGGSPYAMVQQREKVVRKILAVPTTKGTDAHRRKENRLRENINELFDFEELGKRSLVRHWDGLAAEQRGEFVSLLQRLIEKNYLLKIAESTRYKLKWGGEIDENDYKVVRFKIKSGKYEAVIHLRLIEKNGRFVVFDMLIDDVSLMENYRSQFNKIIRKKGFDKLLEKMRRKLEELGGEHQG